ncbi:hypothetical protein [Actinoplanes subtropicus]|uniref:hypothetical protein n=1 Tax=Actinoplanes subtropicus TaxID=543632 RepID=UPI000555F6B2|nr:hypothetical protein [Actinoplanes subtropicus]
MSDRVVLDLAAAHPEATVVRDALAARDWGAVRAGLDAAPPVLRSMLIDDAAERDNLEEFLREVIAADPADTTAVALLAAHLIGVGGHDRLRRAELVLLDGVARNPADPALWVARLTSARGLSLDLAEVDRRYARLAEIDPHHLPGQDAYLQRLCPKGGGDWDRLHGWCRAAMLAAPPAAVQARLVVDGHLEHWLGDGRSRIYLSRKPVRVELYEAARRSIWHPGFRKVPGWVGLASSFAMAFSLLDDRPAAARVFDLLGDLSSKWPWTYLGGTDPAATIVEQRKIAYKYAEIDR